MDENLARQAELAFERQGDYDSLCFEGRWHSSGQLADRAARLATGLADLGVRPGDRLLVLPVGHGPGRPALHRRHDRPV